MEEGGSGIRGSLNTQWSGGRQDGYKAWVSGWEVLPSLPRVLSSPVFRLPPEQILLSFHTPAPIQTFWEQGSQRRSVAPFCLLRLPPCSPDMLMGVALHCPAPVAGQRQHRVSLPRQRLQAGGSQCPPTVSTQVVCPPLPGGDRKQQLSYWAK